MNTIYDILQVREKACPEVIDAAYKALMKLNHPDVNPGADPRIAQGLNRAREILLDPTKRAQYDAHLSNQRGQMQGLNLMYRGPGFHTSGSYIITVDF